MEREVWEGNGQNQATAESNEGSEAVRGEDRDPYLPAAIGEEDHGDGDGGAGHGMGGGHASRWEGCGPSCWHPALSLLSLHTCV